MADAMKQYQHGGLKPRDLRPTAPVEELGVENIEFFKDLPHEAGAATEPSEKHPGHNEDRHIIDKPNKMYVVLDGMGGQANGEEAARRAKELLSTRAAALDRLTVQKAAEKIPQMLSEVSNTLWEEGGRLPPEKGMGTTVAMIKLIENKAVIAHAGDSRVYRFRPSTGNVELLTKDDNAANDPTVIEFALKHQGLSRDQYKRITELLDTVRTQDDVARANLTAPEQKVFDFLFERRNAVTQALGVGRLDKNAGPDVEAHVQVVDTEPGDIYAIFGDGVTDPLPTADIEEGLRLAENSSPSEAAGWFVQKAAAENARGGMRAKKDDKTAIIIKTEIEEIASEELEELAA